MLARNWTQRRMEQEVKRRIDIFEYIKKKKVQNYKDVARIVSGYYKDPDETMKMVRDAIAPAQPPGSGKAS